MDLFWNSLDNAPSSIVSYLEMKVEMEAGVHDIRSRFTPRYYLQFPNILQFKLRLKMADGPTCRHCLYIVTVINSIIIRRLVWAGLRRGLKFMVVPDLMSWWSSCLSKESFRLKPPRMRQFITKHNVSTSNSEIVFKSLFIVYH